MCQHLHLAGLEWFTLRSDYDGATLLRRVDMSDSGLPVLPETAILRVASDIVAGMCFLSDERIVHRYLASSNILVKMDNSCIVGDLSMAQVLAEGETEWCVFGSSFFWVCTGVTNRLCLSASLPLCRSADLSLCLADSHVVCVSVGCTASAHLKIGMRSV